MYQSVENLINKYEKEYAGIIPEGWLEDSVKDYCDDNGYGDYYRDKNGELCYSYNEEEILEKVKEEVDNYLYLIEVEGLSC